MKNWVQDLLLIIFVTFALCSNLIGPAKIADINLPLIGQIKMSAGAIFLPFLYLLSKTVSEIYGENLNRRLTWAGFIAMAIAMVFSVIILSIKPSVDLFELEYQQHLEAVFGHAPRIVVASLCAYVCGMYVNGSVMSRMRKWRKQSLWLRIVSSALCAHFVDTGLFYILAFYGIWSTEIILAVCMTQYLFKTAVEIIFVPSIYWMVKIAHRNMARGTISSVGYSVAS